MLRNATVCHRATEGLPPASALILGAWRGAFGRWLARNPFEGDRP
jgi:hypothetical protein